MKQIWAPTSADPKHAWIVRGARGLPPHVRVIERSAKLLDGKVKLFVCIDGSDGEDEEPQSDADPGSHGSGSNGKGDGQC